MKEVFQASEVTSLQILAFLLGMAVMYLALLIIEIVKQNGNKRN